MLPNIKPVYTADDLRQRVERVGDDEVDPDYGDHQWNVGHPRLGDLAGLKFRPAAVLIPIIDRPDGAGVILTKRTEALRNHSGQVAFPGGRVDDTDPSHEFTALREAEEEIGLRPDLVEVIGQMPDYKSGSGYLISPVIGIVQPGFDLDINPDEVETVFEAPLGFLMNPANHSRGHTEWKGVEWAYYNMPFEGQRIWGVTAGIIRSFYERYYA